MVKMFDLLSDLWALLVPYSFCGMSLQNAFRKRAKWIVSRDRSI